MQIQLQKGWLQIRKVRFLDPIVSSFSDGLSNKEYFAAASGARSGMQDRVLNTATTGYLTRKLVYMLNSVESRSILKSIVKLKELLQ